MMDRIAELFPPRRALLLSMIGYFSFAAILICLQLFVSHDLAIYGSFWESGRAASSGQNPYAIYDLVWTPKEIHPAIPEVNLNPPSMLPLFQVFSMFDPVAGRIAWTIISASIYWIGVALIYRSNPLRSVQIAWLALWPAATTNLGLGQIYSLLFIVGVGICLTLRANKRDLAAVLVGILVAMKPNFALWGLLVFATGQFRPALIAGLVALTLSALPAAIYGPQIFEQWLAAAAIDQHNLYPHDISIRGIFYRADLVDVSYFAVGAVILICTAWAYRVRPSLYDITPVAIILSILCSPIGWFDYMLIVAPFIVDRKWGTCMLVAALLTFTESFWPTFIHSDLPVLVLASLAALTPALMFLAIFLRRAGQKAIEAETAGIWPQLSV